MRSLIAFALLTAASAAAAQPGAWRLTPEGYGAVHIGMSRAQAEAALGTQLEGEAIDDADACIEMAAQRGHPGIFFMFEGWRLSRVSAAEGSHARTPRGIGVGATEAQVRAAYGRGLRSEGHRYQNAPARYLTYWTRARSGVRFETDEHRRVQLIHAGGASIEYIEGCA
jgi:hypothetical protein